MGWALSKDGDEWAETAMFSWRGMPESETTTDFGARVSCWYVWLLETASKQKDNCTTRLRFLDMPRILNGALSGARFILNIRARGLHTLAPSYTTGNRQECVAVFGEPSRIGKQHALV